MMVRPALALLVLASALASLPSEAAGASSTGRSPYILVRFADGASPSLRAADVWEAGGTVVGKVYGLPVTVVRVPVGADPAGVAARYRVLRGVVFAETNGIVHAADTATPNDPSFTKQWGLNNTGQTVNGVAGTADADIDAPEGWSAAGLGSFPASGGVPLGIVDTGIDMTHPEFAGRIAGCAHALSETGAVTAGSCGDGSGHGTHVAGIAAATTNNAVGVAGVAFDAPIYVCKALGTYSGAEADVAGCISWLHDQGARVINMSLEDYADPPPATIQTAVQTAWDGGTADGSVLVAAAGNLEGGTCSYPACFPEVISVSAITNTGVRASFSNYNATVELAAPGKDVYSTWIPETYAYESGTSMASPFVAGSAAIVWQVHSSFTAEQVRDALDLTADDLGTTGRDQFYGYGRVNLAGAVAYTALGTLTVAKVSENGRDGIVTSDPVGIDCGITCSYQFAQGSTVTLTAAPDADTVVSWGSPCSGAGPCTVTVGSSTGVGVTFSDAPPDTTINSGPSGTVTGKSATFTFFSTESGSTFLCSLDGKAATDCSSGSVGYTGLSQGVHTFRVQAVDPQGTPDSTPATRTWTVKSILITRITYKASTLDGEWIRLKNFAGSGVAIGGWTIHDGQGNTYTFGPFTLAGGASVTVHTGKGTNTTTDRYWGRSVQVWGDVQDTATVKRANATVADTCHYDNANASYVLC